MPEKSCNQQQIGQEIGNRIDRLKDATKRAIQKRERLPQPLFWSLFLHEVESIKSQRRKKRDKLRLLFDADWL